MYLSKTYGIAFIAGTILFTEISDSHYYKFNIPKQPHMNEEPRGWIIPVNNHSITLVVSGNITNLTFPNPY